MKEEIQPGKYLARITDCGFKKTSRGDDQVFLNFELEDGRKMMWFGSLKPGKATDFTIDTLLSVGFTSNWDAFAADQADLAEVFENPQKKFQIVVEDEQFQGKTYKKIKWINDPDKAGGSTPRVDPKQAVSIVKSMDLKGLTLQRKQMQGKAQPAKKAANDDFDVPF
jgi:hypothetical protein